MDYVCTVGLHLSYLAAFQLHSCACKHHRRNSNILQCCSLGLYEDAGTCGRHNVANYLQSRLWVFVAPVTCWISCLRLHPICLPSFALFCVASSSALPALIEQWKLLSSRIPKDSSDSGTAIVPSEDPAPTSSQLDVVLNCQLFTQAITEAVILCKYSR